MFAVCGGHSLAQVSEQPAAQPCWQLAATTSPAGVVQPLEQPVSPGMAAQQLIHGGDLTNLLHQCHQHPSDQTTPAMMAHAALHPFVRPLRT